MGQEATRRGVRDTFDRIAKHFARTRQKPWGQVTTFLEDHGPDATGLDIGCANGRHLPALAAVCEMTIGLDASRRLLRVAMRDRGARAALIQGDATQLPFADDSVDIAIYVATIHHLPSEGQRRGSLNELARVLASDAPVLISTWSVTHDRFDDVEPGDRLIPWTLPNGDRLDRYYHLYDLDSFRTTLSASQLQVERVWEEGGNCWALAHGI